jgi:ankyrin repeat protein
MENDLAGNAPQGRTEYQGGQAVACGIMVSLPRRWLVVIKHSALCARGWRGPEGLEARGEEGATPLLWAVVFAPDWVPAMLAAGANPEARDNDDHTALLRALKYGRRSVAKILIDAGADVTAVLTEPRTSSLHLAARHMPYATDMVGLLLEKGVPVDASSSSGTTPLFEATAGGQMTPMVQALLDAGASVHARDRPGHTLWGWLLSRSRPVSLELVQALLKHGASFDDADQFGMDEIPSADGSLVGWVAQCSPNHIPVLLEAGAPVEQRDAKGRTPLMRLAQTIYQGDVSNWGPALDALHAQGADVLARTYDDKGLLDLLRANTFHHPDFVRRFEELHMAAEKSLLQSHTTATQGASRPRL